MTPEEEEPLPDRRKPNPELSPLDEGLFQAMGDPALVSRPDGTFLRANPAACRSLGGTEEEIVRAGRRGIVLDDEVLREKLATRTRSGSVKGRLHLRRLDGTTFPAEFTSSVVTDRSGEPVAYTIFRDVSEGERIEQAERVASRFDRRFRELYEALGDGIVSATPDGTILEANESYLKMLGYSIDELRSMSYPQLTPERWHEEEARTISELFRARGLRATYEKEYRRKDGTVFPIELRVFVRYHDDGPASMWGIVRDLTVQRRSEERLRQSEKMEAVGRLAGGVAHDFNNLLTVILGGARLALDHAPEGGVLREEIDEIHAAARRARDLTRQLLAFSRRQELDPRDVDLNDVVLDSERILTRLIGEHVALRTELAPHLGLVRADPVQLQQVIMNLALNAQDAMPHGGMLTIRTGNLSGQADCQWKGSAAEEGRGCILLTVEDTGVGMDEETRSHIFEPFFTTKPVGKGTGLGLAMVFGTVEQSGGRIQVESAPGRGTRFEICLPRVADRAAPPTEGAGPEGEASRGAGELVLVMEDDEQVRRITSRTLERLGFAVVAAATLEEALERIEAGSRPPAILLSDVRMPVRSGPEVAAALRERFPGLPVVYMSGYSADEFDDTGGLPQGAAFLQKPFSPEDLAERLRAALGESPVR